MTIEERTQEILDEFTMVVDDHGPHGMTHRMLQVDAITGLRVLTRLVAELEERIGEIENAEASRSSDDEEREKREHVRRMIAEGINCHCEWCG